MSLLKDLGITDSPWRVGTTLVTRSTKQWTKEQWDKNQEIEERQLFAHFTSKDQGRGRLKVSSFETKEDAILCSVAPEMLEALIENRSTINYIADLEMNYEAEGCGLEDQGITDRYEAMAYGWEKAMFRVMEVLQEDGYLDIILKATGKTEEELQEILNK